MTTDPIDIVSGAPMSEWIATMPDSLSDVPVGMWRLVPCGKSFGLEGEALVDFLRRCIHALIDAGAMPVRGAGKPNTWVLQTQYGVNKYEIAEAVIAEWLAEGAPTPRGWTGLFFGLPRDYLANKTG
jgi:hypothetical protein